MGKSHPYLFVTVAGKEPEARDLDETSLLFLRTRERLRGRNGEGSRLCGAVVKRDNSTMRIQANPLTGLTSSS